LGGVELFLNLVWFLMSLLLIVHWTRAAHTDRSRQTWKAAIALLLLVLLLLPVISVTDDLVALAGLSEAEHTEHQVRRGEMPLLHIDVSAALDIGAFAAQLFVGLAFLSALLSRVVPRPNAVKLDGFGRVAGIRPPPSAALLAV
jgi:hypothetical protein